MGAQVELRHLRYFVAVAEELHFRRAAERLNMSQPPLSLQIKELERELGIPLFDRNRQHVALTPGGMALLPDARRVLESVSAAAKNARNAADGEFGELRVGLTQSAEFLSFLPETLHRLRVRYPAILVSFQQRTTTEQIDAVAHERLDLGILRKPAEKLPREVRLTRLYPDPLMLAVHAHDPLAAHAFVHMRDLRDRAFVLSPADAQSGLHDAVVELARAARFFPRLVQEVRQITTTIGMVAAGVGVAIVPASARCIHIGQVALVPIVDPGAQSWLHMITRAEPRGRVMAELTAMLLEAAASVPTG